jgi:hypothetical protein
MVNLSATRDARTSGEPSAYQRYSKPFTERVRETLAPQDRPDSASPPLTSGFTPDRTDAHLAQSPNVPLQVVNYSYQRIGELRLTWGNVFELVFMFTVAFIVIDAIVIFVLALIIAAFIQ